METWSSALATPSPVRRQEEGEEQVQFAYLRNLCGCEGYRRYLRVAMTTNCCTRAPRRLTGPCKLNVTHDTAVKIRDTTRMSRHVTQHSCQDTWQHSCLYSVVKTLDTYTGANTHTDTQTRTHAVVVTHLFLHNDESVKSRVVQQPDGVEGSIRVGTDGRWRCQTPQPSMPHPVFHRHKYTAPYSHLLPPNKKEQTNSKTLVPLFLYSLIIVLFLFAKRIN